MPEADAVHGHELGVAAQGILDVVVAHEDRQRQAVLLDGLHRDDAVPPAAVLLRAVLVALVLHERGIQLVGHHLVELADVRRHLDGCAVSVIGDVARVLPAHVGLKEVHHGALHEVVLVGVVDDGEQVVRADDALGVNDHVIVHEQHVCGLGLLLHGADHAVGIAARAAHVGVGVDVHTWGLEGRHVQRAAIVHHVLRKVRSHRLVGGKDAVLHKADVALNVALLLEGGSAERKLDRADVSLVHEGVVVGVAQPHLARLGDGDAEGLDDVTLGGGHGDVQLVPVI